MVIFTDIHGNFDTFIKLHSTIPKEYIDKGVVIAGDLIDRGPKSRQMLQWCMNHPEVDVIIGNHEQMMIDERESALETFIDGVDDYGIWLVNGGREALKSYEKENGDFDYTLYNKHINWLKSLPFYKEYDSIKNDKGKHLLVTHSSADKVWHWDENRRKIMSRIFKEYILWGRGSYIRPIKNVFNVFGHTPTPVEPKIKSHYANIDTGCFVNDKHYGKLTALVFPEMKVYQQDNIDGFYKLGGSE